MSRDSFAAASSSLLTSLSATDSVFSAEIYAAFSKQSARSRTAGVVNMRMIPRALIFIACIGAIGLLTTYAVAAAEIILSVPGIPGPYCAYGVEKRLLELDGVQRVELLWKEQKIRAVIAEGKIVTLEQIRMAVKKADYPYDYEIVKP